MDLNINVINDWDKWKKTLYTAISMGETVGLSGDTIAKIGTKIGDFLSSNIDPENREQRLLKELFEACSNEQKETLTKIIIKLVEKDH
ncbi:DUF3243 domain-containing protein [Clostridium lacusfryxellense]|uniref:DUF3243 domain-containing protein n=1 Tax=Clostridium lacusfryxellense TaxID=205328 RepID=UPI001C0DED05|nr:DUF3243 domain-containing protein [Clostridium lacusfryxellense]MBU3111416.1 DUF3243 domain-containing protein [Clostridium lacusfryxellense]